MIPAAAFAVDDVSPARRTHAGAEPLLATTFDLADAMRIVHVVYAPGSGLRLDRSRTVNP